MRASSGAVCPCLCAAAPSACRDERTIRLVAVAGACDRVALEASGATAAGVAETSRASSETASRLERSEEGLPSGSVVLARRRADDGRRSMVIQRSNHLFASRSPARDRGRATGPTGYPPANGPSHRVSGRPGDLGREAWSARTARDPTMHAQVGNLSEVTLFSVISRMRLTPPSHLHAWPNPTSVLELATFPLDCILQHATERRTPRPVRARSPRRRGN